MQLDYIEIHGFRSIRHLSLRVSPFQTLLGPNNCGKSNLLAALEFYFESKSRVSTHDFYQDTTNGRVAELSVTLTFSALGPAEIQEFGRYVLPQNRLKVAKTARLSGGVPATPEYHGVMLAPTDSRFDPARYQGSPSVRLELVNQAFPEAAAYRRPGRLSDEVVDEMLAAVAQAHQGELTWEERLDSAQFFGVRQVAASKLGRFFYLPAIPDPSSETDAKSGSNFGALMHGILEDVGASSREYVEASQKLKDAVGHFNRSLGDGTPNPTRPSPLSDLEREISSELRDWSVDVEIEVAVPLIDELISRPSVNVDDGYSSPLEVKGHGLQRAFLLALLAIWRNHVVSRKSAQTGSTDNPPVIIAIEEPELYLHPQRQRQMFTFLKDLSNAPGHHVFLVSHSPVFIDMSSTTSIVRMWKGATGSTDCRRLQTGIFEGAGNEAKKRRFQLVQWIDPSRGELFFASKVILVEGPTEIAVLPYVARRIGVIDADVSVVACGGKGAIPLYIELLKSFDIPFRVLHDEDPIRAQPGDSDYPSQRRVFELNQLIASQVGVPAQVRVVVPKLESIIGVPTSQAEKLGKPLAALEHIEANGTTEALEELVRWAYAP